MTTSLPVDEVSRRLRAAVVSPMALFRSRLDFPVAGRVQKKSCQIYARPSAFARNSFFRVLALNFVEAGSGTLLEGQYRLPWFLVGFMCFWLGFLGVITTALLTHEFRSGGFATLADPWIYQPLGMGTFGLLLLWFGLWWSRRSEPKVEEFLREVLGDGVVGSTMNTVAGEILVRPRHEAVNSSEG